MKNIFFKVLSVFAVLALMVAALPIQSAQAATPIELFFSEYIEGTSYNKALEIYNGTGATIDLAAGGYKVQIFFNGSSSAGITLTLTGTLANGDVYVVANTNATTPADPAILAQADLVSSAGFYNGDDAVALVKNGVIIDVIGQIGFDPGSEWGTGLISTQDNTLRRKADVCAGDPDGSNVFDPSLEWDGFATNAFDGLGSHTTNCTPSVIEPKINEFSASTVGTDVEYVEFFGSPNTDYSAYTALEIEGDFASTGAGQGVADEIISLGTTDSDGLYLVNLPANALENGSLTLLLVKNFTGTFGSDLDTNNDGVFDVTPWDSVVDAVAVNDGGASDLAYGVPVLGVAYDGAAYAPGGASRIPDGFDTDAASDWVRNDFDLAGIPGYAGTIVLGEAYNTPGALNEKFVPPPEACGDPFTPIYDVQGNGLASPLVGSEVAIEGIVVGDFQNNASTDSGNLNGFFVQDVTGDADATTSDAIFVYASGAMDFSVGDVVRVRGNVSEYHNLTEISASQVWQCSTGNSVPTPVSLSLPMNTVNDFEAYEGMLVSFSQSLVISEYFNYDRYGEIVLTSYRHLTPTAEFEPGSPEAMQAMQDYLLDRVTLDDGRSAQNPDPAIHPNGSVFDLTNLFRGGDLVANVTGLLDQFDAPYRVQPVQGADYTSANPRPAQPADVGGNLKVVSMNTLNFFSTIDKGTSYWICGPAQNQECRGADTADEFDRQRAKLIAAITEMDADVIGLLEIENNVNDEAMQNLVDGLNNALGAGTYDYIHTGVIGTDAIKVALIYKPATVSLVGNYAILDSSVDPRFIDTKNRPALAQTFMETTTGGIFTVVVNHLKSKGSDCNDLGDPDLGDGAGNCNITRTLAAQALVDWLATDPTGSGDADFLIIGDLNSYDKEDPIDAIKAGPDDVLGTADDYIDLVLQFQGEYAYSYIFDGQIGYLDYGLASANLVGQVTDVSDWHVNADEPDLIDYDMSFKLPAQDALYAPDPFRYSDHDPVIIGLNVCDEIAPVFEEVSVSPDSLWPANHKYMAVVATVVVSDNFDLNPTVTLVSITSNEPDDGLDDGDTANDILIVDDFHFKLRAERSGTGTGRVYTIIYMVADACGNTTYQSVFVFVPLSQMKE